MTPLLSDYKTLVQDRLLNLLWRQWTALGVIGHAALATDADRSRGPPARVLHAGTPRRAFLFDAILDWLTVNGRYLNVQRVRRLSADSPFAGGAVFAAMAAKTSNLRFRHQMARSAKPTKKAASEQSCFLSSERAAAASSSTHRIPTCRLRMGEGSV